MKLFSRRSVMIMSVTVFLVVGATGWFLLDQYIVHLWWQRIMHPSLEYRDYNGSEGDITDEEMTESAKAVKLVEQLPEVVEWRKQFFGPKGTSPETGAVGWVQTEKRLGDVYSVHVYEEPGLYLHFPIKTFGWYEVDRRSWEIVGNKH